MILFGYYLIYFLLLQQLHINVDYLTHITNFHSSNYSNVKLNKIIETIQYHKLIHQIMKKTVKYLRFQNLKIQLQQKHPKQVSRAVLCFKDEQGNTYKTSKYGQVTPQTIQWQDSVQIIYTNQQVFKIETICEHQYGYQIDELEAMYNGQVYIKTQNFFRPLTVHVFNSEGGKCGIMKYLIKVIQRQVQKTAQHKVEQVVEQAVVQVDLIGKITLYAASIIISNPAFKKDRYVNDLSLSIQICGQKINANYKKNFQWSFPGSKIEYNQNSPDEVILVLKQQNQVVLAGQTQMNTIMENKRFVTHSIVLYNANQQKVGTLKLDLRFITKQELLDLMYSPTKLSKQKDHHQNTKQHANYSENQVKLTSRKTHAQKNGLYKSRANSSLLETTRKTEALKVAASQHALQPEAAPRSSDRYKKVHVNSGYNEIIFSKEKRFFEQKYVNPYVSYSDPAKLSDFSPNNKNGYHHKKGPDISLSRKMDFTRQYKNNPGVGQYKLPSIWDKY